MALVKMKDLLRRAEEKNIGCGAFSVGNMEMVRGAIRAAEELDTPIILQIAEVRLKNSPLHLMGPMMVQAAKEAKVDVAVHLDHGLTFETVDKALELGFTSVMLDASTLSVAVAGLDELDRAANCWQRLYAICDERLRGIQISGGNKLRALLEGRDLCE